MNRRNIIVAGIIICFMVGFFGIGQVSLLAEETGLQILCNQLNDFKRYEGKKIGFEETQSPSWDIGEEIVSYREEAIPLLLDIYQNSDNLIAQLFAARLIGEIDIGMGKKLLDNFKDNERTIETIFNSSIETMAIGDVARKELAILEAQRKKTESTQSHLKSKI